MLVVTFVNKWSLNSTQYLPAFPGKDSEMNTWQFNQTLTRNSDNLAKVT